MGHPTISAEQLAELIEILQDEKTRLERTIQRARDDGPVKLDQQAWDAPVIQDLPDPPVQQVWVQQALPARLDLRVWVQQVKLDLRV